MPALTSLVLSCQIANEWFVPDWLDTLFPPVPTAPSPKSYAFPALTHFTLTDLQNVPDNGHDGSAAGLPKLPLAHMPNLTHFTIPAQYKGRRLTHYLSPDDLAQLAQLPRLESLCIPSVDQIWGRGGRRRRKHVFPASVTHLELQFDLFKDLHSHATFPGLTALTLHMSRKTHPDLFYSTPVLGRHYSHLSSLTLHLTKFNQFTWPRLQRQVPGLKHLAIHAPRNSGKNNTEAIATWTAGAPLVFPTLESLDLSMTETGTFDLTGLAFPALRDLALVTARPRLDPRATLVPRLERLKVACGPAGAVSPHWVDFVTHPLLGPSFGFKLVGFAHDDHVIKEKERIMGSVPTLVMHFLGTLDNRRSWRTLLGDATGGGGIVARLEQGAVKQAVIVNVAALPLGAADARLIATTLSRLLVDHKARSVAVTVVKLGLRATEDNVALVKQSIEQLHISSVSSVEAA